MLRLFLVSTVVFAAAADLSAAAAQVQDKDQQACLNKMGLSARKVIQAQSKEQLRCIKNAGRAKLTGTADACIVADAKGKVAKKTAATITSEARFCETEPDFGFDDAATSNSAALQWERDLLDDLFGGDLDGALVDCDTSRDGCRCQLGVAKRADQLALAYFKEFLRCQKSALRAGKDPFVGGAASASNLTGCVDDSETTGSLAADSKNRLAKAAAKINKEVDRRCDDAGVSETSFPGLCSGLTGTTLSDCIAGNVRCRACEAIREMSDLTIDCDAFDDTNANGSCLDKATATVTPTPTPGSVGSLVEKGKGRHPSAV